MTAAARLGVLAACAALGACGYFGDSAKKPSPLVEFQPSATLRTVRSASVGTSGGHRFVPDHAAGRIHAVSRIESDTSTLTIHACPL